VSACLSSELIRVAIANRSAGAVPRAIEIETRKATDAFADCVVERRRKTERGQVQSILAFRCIRSADETIKAIPEIQHGVGIDRVNFVQDRLFGGEDKSVSDVNRIRVVVIGALPVVPAIATKQFVFLADTLVQPDGVVSVRRIKKLGKRRVSNVVVEQKVTLRSVFRCAPVRHHSLGYRTDPGIGNLVARELRAVSDVAARECAGERIVDLDLIRIGGEIAGLQSVSRYPDIVCIESRSRVVDALI
jgi:hypothetical protein